MDIEEIGDRITGKQIMSVDITYGEDTMTIHFDDGSVLEIIVDSIYLDTLDYDD